jgi:excisionase family DNA binding protein
MGWLPGAAGQPVLFEAEVRAAMQGQRVLAAHLATGPATQTIQIPGSDRAPHQVEVPTTALRLLGDVLAELAAGNAVRVVPVHAELTTQDAADLLNVSRPHLVKLLEEGALPFHRAGKHRRVRFADLMQFKAAREAASHDAMKALAEQALGLKLGYE